MGSGAQGDVTVGSGAGGLDVVDVPGVGRCAAVDGGGDGGVVTAGAAEAGVFCRADEVHRGGGDANSTVEGVQCFWGGDAKVVGGPAPGAVGEE